MIRRTTTIDQHRGMHPATGLRITALHEVVSAYPLLDEGDADDEKWVDEVHALRVEMESLEADQRERALEWLARHDGDDLEEIEAYRNAIREARR